MVSLESMMSFLPINQILCGDCYELIRHIPDQSVDLVITSPPYYQQRDYGAGIGNEENVEAYIEHLLHIFAECIRITHPEGNIVFNVGDKYEDASLLLVPYRFAAAATTRFDVRLVNHVTWVKKNPTPRQFRRRLVSSTEPFFHFAKTNDYTYNIDAFMSIEKSTHKKGTGLNKGKRYFELIEQSDLSIEQKMKAREAVYAVIDELIAGKIDDFRVKIRGIHSEPFGGQAGGRQIQLDNNGFTIIRLYGNPMKRDVIEMPVESLKGRNHPAMYPVDLVVEFLNLLTQEGDIVLDPFMGSGSTAVACKKVGRRYIGFELNADYCKFAEERLADEVITQLKLV